MMQSVSMGGFCFNARGLGLLFVITLFFGAGFIFQSNASAKEEDLSPAKRKEYLEIAGQLRCPTCTGLSVLDSSAGFSEQIKDQVMKQIELGKSHQEILDYFVDRYGPWILREPPKDGFNLLAWALPIALLIFGPFFIWLFVWRRRVTVATHGVRGVDAIVSEMEQELRTLREG